VSRPDGGPAFPNITPDMNVDGGPGMSLRDYFAAKAMQGLIMRRDWTHIPERDTALAYEYADVMLAERAK
jgi:hypothetical protein